MPKLESRLADIVLRKSACSHHSQKANPQHNSREALHHNSRGAPQTLQLGKTSLNTTQEEPAHHNQRGTHPIQLRVDFPHQLEEPHVTGSLATYTSKLNRNNHAHCY